VSTIIEDEMLLS